jgi:hypothetical protein
MKFMPQQIDEEPSTGVRSSAMLENSERIPVSERWQAAILLVLSVTSFIFWLCHSFAMRNAIVGIRILVGMRH